MFSANTRARPQPAHQYTNVLSVCLQGGQPAEGRGREKELGVRLGDKRRGQTCHVGGAGGDMIVYSAAPDVSISPPPGGGSHSPPRGGKGYIPWPPDIGSLTATPHCLLLARFPLGFHVGEDAFLFCAGI